MSNTPCLKKDEYFSGTPDFPLRVIIRSPQPPGFFHRHEFFECAFVSAGRGRHRSGGNAPVEISSGDVLLIPPDARHGYAETENMTVINLLFDSSRLPALLMDLCSLPAYRELFVRDASHYKNRDYPKLTPDRKVFDEMKEYLLRILESDRLPCGHCYKLGLFMALMSRLCCLPRPEGAGSAELPRDIERLSAYMQRNFGREIYIGDLLEVSNMSEASLVRHFRAAFGVSPMAYLRRIRLTHAAELLQNTDHSLKEIAEETGFSSVSYFFRLFRRFYGVTPQVYRTGADRTSGGDPKD